MKRFSVVIRADGAIEVEISGGLGKQCLDEIPTVTQLVGSDKIVESSLTREYSETQSDNAVTTVELGADG
jgi:hypothetical protein